MAEIELLFYDAVIVETEDAIKSPPAVASCDDIPTIPEAYKMASALIFCGDYKAIAILQGGLFFMGLSLTDAGIVRVIHTPAADAYLDEFHPSWRHALALPMSEN